MQEVTTRWWSILMLLESIMKNIDSLTIAVNNHGRESLILSITEQNEIKSIIELLKVFKYVGETLSSEKVVTISLIQPMFIEIRQELRCSSRDSE